MLPRLGVEQHPGGARGDPQGWLRQGPPVWQMLGGQILATLARQGSGEKPPEPLQQARQ